EHRVPDLRQHHCRAGLPVGRHRPSLLRRHPQARLPDRAWTHRDLRRCHASGGPAGGPEVRGGRSARASRGEGPLMWKLTWRRFRRSKLAIVALLYVASITVIAAAAPLVAERGRVVPFAPDDVDFASRMQPP